MLTTVPVHHVYRCHTKVKLKLHIINNIITFFYVHFSRCSTKKKKVKAAAVTSLTLTEVKAQVASQTTQ